VDPILLASLAALVLGPLVLEWTRGNWTLAAVDAFALVAVGGLVGVHILPQSFVLGGWGAIPVFLFGLLGPGLLCGTRILAGSTGSKITLPLALLGIALHALLDGVALASGTRDALAVAVVLHRVSDGVGIWWLARPAYGRRMAFLLLGVLAAFSVVGYAFAQPIAGGTSHMMFGLVQALIAGSLLHVILRHPPSAPRGAGGQGRTTLASGIGGLVGLALVLSLEGFVEHRGAEGGAHRFVELALQSAPALLAAYLAVAVLQALELDLRKLLGGGRALGQTLRGAALGLPMPICSCGVVPLYRSLVLQGVPTPAALSFLIAAPELGVTAVFLSLSLLGPEITLARTACAALLALAVGLLVGRGAPLREKAVAPAEGARRPPFLARLPGGLRYGLGDMVDATAPWILVGLGLAAVLEPWISPERMAHLPSGLEVPLFALIGLPLYVCASGSTPLAAVLIAKGVSPGAAIAFLLTGPATNVTTFGLLSRLHSRTTALTFALVTLVATTGLGMGANALLGAGPDLVAGHLHDGHGALEMAAAIVLLALFALSVLRQGTRSFVSQVIAPHGADAHDHCHDEHEHAGHACCG
jgi:uncharacterized membrane protein YraQ (UPF0718 family)